MSPLTPSTYNQVNANTNASVNDKRFPKVNDRTHIRRVLGHSTCLTFDTGKRSSRSRSEYPDSGHVNVSRDTSPGLEEPNYEKTVVEL